MTEKIRIVKRSNEPTKLKKIERFIKNRYHHLKSIVTYPINRLKTVHNLLHQSMEEGGFSPIELFGNWILDVIQVGFIAMIFYTSFFGWPGFFQAVWMMFGLGVIPTMIRFLRESIING